MECPFHVSPHHSFVIVFPRFFQGVMPLPYHFSVVHVIIRCRVYFYPIENSERQGERLGEEDMSKEA